MRHSKTVNDVIRYVIDYKQGDPKKTIMVEVMGKKKALRAAGLPDNLAAASPAESRWGKVVSLSEAKNILGLQ